MKPRMKTAPLTEEDSRIWTRPKQYAYNGAFFLSRYQDRRDADLMLRILYRGCRFCGEPPHPSLGDVLHLRTCVYATTGARLIIYEGQR